MIKTNTSCNTMRLLALPSGYSHSNSFAPKKWQGCSPVAKNIWTDGTNIYYSYNSTQYVLDGDTWVEKTWKGLTNFCGVNVWTDGTNIYYSDTYGASADQYVLNGDTWEPKTWSIAKKTLCGAYIWTDGENIYHSHVGLGDMVLNGDTWEEKTGWGAVTVGSGNIWSDGENIYHSEGTTQYYLSKTDDIWYKRTWNELTDFNGDDVWTDGNNYYYKKSHVLNGDTWEEITWNGLSDATSYGVWTDGTNIYFSQTNSQRVLLPTTAKLYQRVGDSTGGEWVEMDALGDGNESGDSSGGGASFDNGYAVTFVSQEATWAVSGITPGQAVQRPTSPTKDGAYFNGWYTGEDGSGEKISFPYTPTADATLYAKFSQATVVGVTGVMNEEGSLTLTDDIAGMEGYEEAQNGDYVSVTSKLSEAFPFCEIEEFADDEGNTFVKFPKLWMKWETDDSDQITGYKFANYQADSDFFIPDAFLDPNYVTTDTYLDYFALGKYEMSGSTSKGYSKSGATCLVNVTRANARAAARAYGNSSNLYNGYQMLDFAQMTLYNLLCMMFFQTTNIQKVYGGRTGSGTVTSWSAASVTGTTDGVDGLNGWNVTTDCVKLLGVENPFGNVFKWVDGAYFSKGVIYAHRFPQQFNDGTTNGTALGFERPTSSGYIIALKKGTANKTRSYVYAAAIGGDAGQYCGDYTWYSSTGTVLSAGGHWGDGGAAGLWALRGRNAASDSYSNIGARLSYRPL